jgi:hypothetical protein
MKTSLRFSVAVATLAAGLGLGLGTATNAQAQGGPFPMDPCAPGVNCAHPGPAPNSEQAPRSRYLYNVPDDDLSGRGSDGGGGGGG